MSRTDPEVLRAIVTVALLAAVIITLLAFGIGDDSLGFWTGDAAGVTRTSAGAATASASD